MIDETGRDQRGCSIGTIEMDRVGETAATSFSQINIHSRINRKVLIDGGREIHDAVIVKVTRDYAVGKIALTVRKVDHAHPLEGPVGVAVHHVDTAAWLTTSQK